MQQVLGALLNYLQSENVNGDSAVQPVRDIFAMSTKALYQVGRTDAFQAAASDTGLNSLKEVQAKVMYFPLSCDEERLRRTKRAVVFI